MALGLPDAPKPATATVPSAAPAPVRIPPPAETPAPSRRSRIGWTVTLYVASALVVWGAIAILTSRYAPAPWDVTHERLFTLSPTTRDLLKRVAKPLRITLVFPRRGDVTSQMLDEILTLLDLFKVETRLVEVRRIDSDHDPAAARELFDRLKLDPRRMLRSAVVEYGDRSRHVSSDQLISVEAVNDRGTLAVREAAFFGEQALGSAILSLLEDDAPAIDLLAGHGELDPDSFRSDGFSYARDAMRVERMQVRPRFLLETGKVPEDTRVLVIAGPREALDGSEVSAIREFLERGGGIFLAQEPQRFSGLEPLLSSYGIALGDDIVLDFENKALRTDAATLYVTRKGDHAITNPIRNAAIRVSRSRSVDRRETPTLPKRLERAELLFSSPASWAETNLAKLPPSLEPDSGDRAGPISLAMAAALPADPSEPVAQQHGGLRLVVLGSRESLTNALISKFGMGDFFQNSVNWLAKRDRLVSLRPRTPDARPLRITESQARNLALAAYFGPPGVFLLLGLWIAWRRRA